MGVIEAQRRNINTIVERAHWVYLLSMEALIKRYEAKLLLTARSYTQQLKYAGNQDATLTQMVHDLARLGTIYIHAAAVMGFERGLRDLVLMGWLESYRRPVEIPPQVYQDADEENTKYLYTSLLPDMKKLMGRDGELTVMRYFAHRLRSYSHWLWPTGQQAYRTAIQDYHSSSK